MKFYALFQNQKFFAEGKLVAQFVDGEFDTQNPELIAILKQAGFRSTGGLSVPEPTDAVKKPASRSKAHKE